MHHFSVAKYFIYPDLTIMGLNVKSPVGLLGDLYGKRSIDSINLSKLIELKSANTFSLLREFNCPVLCWHIFKLTLKKLDSL